MVWLKVVTRVKPTAFETIEEKGFIDLSKVEEVQTRTHPYEKGLSLIKLIDKKGNLIGTLTVPKEETYKITYQILELISMSKHGKGSSRMIELQDGKLMEYDPEKDTLVPLKE